MTTVWPAATAPTVQVTTPALTGQAPPGPVAETNVTPSGNVSVTTTPDAAAGPPFTTASVYVSGEPATTAAGAVPAIATFASPGFAFHVTVAPPDVAVWVLPSA